MQVQDSVTHGIAGSANLLLETRQVLFIILGPDRALAQRELNRARADLDPSGMSTDRIDALGQSFEAMVAAVSAAPFFGPIRVVVLEGLLGLAAAKSGRGGRARADADLPRLLAVVPATTTLILFEPELGEISSAIRKQLPTELTLTSNEAPRGSALVNLAQRFALEQESSLEAPVARLLLDRLFPGSWAQAQANRAYDRPPSIALLESEIAKLALASFPGPIDSPTVSEMIPQRAEERIFPLLDAALTGNRRVALAEVEELRHTGEDPGRTLAQLFQQIELGAAAGAKGRPSDAAEAGKALGITNAYRMGKVEQAARRAAVMPARQLRRALDVDRGIKSGRLRNPEDGLIELVVRVTEQTESR